MQHKQQLQELESEYSRLKHKCEKKDGLLDEYESKIEGLQSELQRAEETGRKLKGELVSKGRLADECLERLRTLDEERRREEDGARGQLKAAEERVRKASELLGRKEQRIQELEGGIVEVKNAYSQRLAELQQLNKALQEDAALKEREIRTLIFEIDRQKAAVKENLAGLTRLFS